MKYIILAIGTYSIIFCCFALILISKRFKVQPIVKHTTLEVLKEWLGANIPVNEHSVEVYDTIAGMTSTEDIKDYIDRNLEEFDFELRARDVPYGQAYAPMRTSKGQPVKKRRVYGKAWTTNDIDVKAMTYLKFQECISEVI